jgi:hypothetical protein
LETIQVFIAKLCALTNKASKTSFVSTAKQLTTISVEFFSSYHISVLLGKQNFEVYTGTSRQSNNCWPSAVILARIIQTLLHRQRRIAHGVPQFKLHSPNH